jgi:periplasmic protein TonB
MSMIHRTACALLLALGLLQPAAADPKLIKKVPPDFPEEATRRNISDGTLKAKLTIDGQGAVTAVQILDAAPPKAKVFNDAAVAALSKWRFEPSGKGESVEIKLVFAQE